MVARAHGRYPLTWYRSGPLRDPIEAMLRWGPGAGRFRPLETAYGEASREVEGTGVKVVNSLKSAKKRHKECRVIRRKGRVYVVNKRNPRFKARQG